MRRVFTGAWSSRRSWPLEPRLRLPSCFPPAIRTGKMAMASRPRTGRTSRSRPRMIRPDVPGEPDQRDVRRARSRASIVKVDVRSPVFPDSDTVRVIHVLTRATPPTTRSLPRLRGGDPELHDGGSEPDFTALNSVLNGIHPSPGQFTGAKGRCRAGRSGSTSR
jgi:hypothetical protein